MQNSTDLWLLNLRRSVIKGQEIIHQSKWQSGTYLIQLPNVNPKMAVSPGVKKFGVFGSNGVGKTLYAMKFGKCEINHDLELLSDGMYTQEIDHQGGKIMVEVCDIGGGDRFSAIRNLYLTASEGFILMYSVTNRYSFSALTSLIEWVASIKEVENTPLVIVGNKCDLEEDRVVSTEEGLRYAEKYHSPFYETSAKFHINIDEALAELANHIRNSNKWENAKKKQKQCSVD